MTEQHVIKLTDISRFYKLYDSQSGRLKEALSPRGKKFHREFFALRDVNLGVNRGEILGILGRNGSGKSTLLKVITGILKPSSGSVQVKGRISALLELGTGFNPEFTGRENIFFHGIVNGFEKSFMASRLDAIIEFADLGEFIDQPLKSYSSGMKTRLGFAVAIHVSPDILVLDEVLAVGDELFKRKCFAKMEEFLRNGTTILYVSHDLNSVVQMCTRAVLLHQGRIIESGSPKTVANDYQRILYATEENREKLIGQLLQQKPLADPPADLRTTDHRTRNGETEQSLSADQTNRATDGPDEFEPKSAKEYRNEEIDILDVHFRDMDGQRVNLLNFGERYCYSVKYHSKSSRSFGQLAFGFQIKGLKGTVLTSLDAQRCYEKQLFVESIDPGDIIEVSVEFECQLPAGTYFTNSGLSSFDTGEQNVLNRIIDSSSFKVLDSPMRVFGGLFSSIRELSVKTPAGEQKFPLE